jgi:hypothetical protein
MSAVDNLEKGNIGVTRKVNILCAMRDNLH